MKRTVASALRFSSLWLVFSLLLPAPAAVSAPAPPPLQLQASSAYLLLNEVHFFPALGQPEWVELANPGAEPVLIGGWSLGDEDGHSYLFPDSLPAVPPGAFVLVRFDGLGSAQDEIDFADLLATLHTPPGLQNIFDDQADQVSLKRFSASLYLPVILHSGPAVQAGANAPLEIASPQVAFVAWGAPPLEDAAGAEQAGLWHTSRFVNLSTGAGVYLEEQALAPDLSIGLLPGQEPVQAENWVMYIEGEATPGAANPPPRPLWSATDSGAIMASDGFALGWDYTPHATYRLQMDDDPAFGSTAVDLLLEQPFYAPASPPAPGDYWWRVRLLLPPGLEGAWSQPAQVSIEPSIAFDEPSLNQVGLAPLEQTLLSISWQRQRKDTNLLCLDGDPEGDPESTVEEAAWDTVHPDDIFPHGEYNCARASTAMVAGMFGGTLSQDYLAYRLFENQGDPIDNQGELNTPLYDLGHNRPIAGCGADGATISSAVGLGPGGERERDHLHQHQAGF